MDQQTDHLHTGKGALWPFLKRMIHYSLNYKNWLYSFIFWIMITAIVDAIFPLLLLGLIDYAITPQLQLMKAAMENGTTHTTDFAQVFKFLGLFALAGAIQAFAVYMFVRNTGRMAEYVMYDLREQMFRKLQRLSFSFYDRSASGWLLSRLTSDTDRVAEVISWGLLDAFWGITSIVFCQIAIFYYNWKLGLIIFVSVPILLVASVKIRMLVLKYSRESRKINSDITAFYNENINGVMINKSTGQEQRVGQDFNVLTSKMKRSSYRSSYYTAMYLPVVIFIGALAAAFVVFFGGNMAIALPPVITIGVLIASFDYALKIFLPIIDISMFYAQAQGCLSAGERIFSLIDEKEEIQNQEGASDFKDIKGAITFSNVAFHYNENNPVLTDFNLKIEAGTSVALVGATGEGKSTIVNLVARFYEPTNGQLLVDGVDYTTKSLQSLRSNLGIVLQTPHLFSGTIQENIVYGRQEATLADIEQALALVGGQDFLPRLKEEVGENGDQLSMGERQLISFARAILTDPAIFIMDEATSSIDTLTEARIQQGIEKMLNQRTAIIIAHRLSTIKNCDRILVIQKGNIIEDGSHRELLMAKGKYYDLYTHQLREERLGELTS